MSTFNYKPLPLSVLIIIVKYLNFVIVYLFYYIKSIIVNVYNNIFPFRHWFNKRNNRWELTIYGVYDIFMAELNEIL